MQAGRARQHESVGWACGGPLAKPQEKAFILDIGCPQLDKKGTTHGGKVGSQSGLDQKQLEISYTSFKKKESLLA